MSRSRDPIACHQPTMLGLRWDFPDGSAATLRPALLGRSGRAGFGTAGEAREDCGAHRDARCEDSVTVGGAGTRPTHQGLDEAVSGSRAAGGAGSFRASSKEAPSSACRTLMGLSSANGQGRGRDAGRAGWGGAGQLKWSQAAAYAEKKSSFHLRPPLSWPGRREPRREWWQPGSNKRPCDL